MLNTTRPRARVSGLAPLALLLAAASPGTVSWTTYLRQGAGDRYAVIDEIEPQARLQVQSCTGDWCRVKYQGRFGYVEAALLHAPRIHTGAPAGMRGGTCFDVRLNGTDTGDRENFCVR